MFPLLRRGRNSAPRSSPLTAQPRGLLWAETRKLGLRLLNQQCWCWGCDIKRAEGNLLLEYGFVRERPPEGVVGSSAYHCTFAPGEQLSLWGFGVCYQEAEHGVIFLSRATFLPELLEQPDIAPQHIWTPEALPDMAAPEGAAERARVRRLLARAARRIAAYEGWVTATAGLAYRERCVRDWNKQSLAPTEAIACWLLIAEECERGAAPAIVR